MEGGEAKGQKEKGDKTEVQKAISKGDFFYSLLVVLFVGDF